MFSVGAFGRNEIGVPNKDELCEKCFNISTTLYQSLQLDYEVKQQIKFLKEFACPLMGEGKKFF